MFILFIFCTEVQVYIVYKILFTLMLFSGYLLSNARFLPDIGAFVHRTIPIKRASILLPVHQVLHYSPLGGTLFYNETMDMSMRQGNTQHKVNGSYICHHTKVPDNTLN